MIFRSIVTAMVVVAVASAAMITVPIHTTTASPINTFPDDTEISTMQPADPPTTVKPATPAPATLAPATLAPATLAPATLAPATPAPATPAPAPAPAPALTTPAPTPTTANVMPTESTMVSCYCNLPECLAAAGGDGTCSTRLGCFSEVQPIIPGIEEEIVTPAVAESNNTVNGSSVSPIIPELLEGEKAPVAATTEHAASIRGSFGCLDLLPFAKQSCDEMLKSMEAEISEFPVIQAPINAARSSANNAGVLAFHCCQTQRCNGNLSGPAEGSVKSAQAVLVAALKTAFVAEVRNFPRWENSTVGGPGKVASTVKSSDNDVELSNAQKTKSATPDMWHAFFSMGEPKAPSALKSADTTEDASLVDVTTPAAVPEAVPSTLPVMAVPAIQEMTQNETVSHVGHVITKRHDSQRAVPVIKQTDDDQENIGDFDDDIAAEVAAVAATAKSPVMPSIPIEKDTPSPSIPIKKDTPYSSVLIEKDIPSSSIPIKKDTPHSSILIEKDIPSSSIPIKKDTPHFSIPIEDSEDSMMPIEEDSPSSWSPRHGGVPDFISPPALKKNNNSYSPSRGVHNNNNSDSNNNNHAGSNNYHTGMNDTTFLRWVVCIICTTIVLFICVVSAFSISLLKILHNEIFRDLKGECSNPGQPCACSGGFTRRRPRTQPSSYDPDAEVNHHACTTPLLPLEELVHKKHRGHANAGASYNDSTGDTTYVFTTIPVPKNVAPLMVSRR